MDRKMKFKIICILLFPAALIINGLSHNDPGLTESIYSMGIYRFFSVIFSNIFGIFHFSVIEMFLILLIPSFVIYVMVSVFKMKKKVNKKSKIKKPNRSIGIITAIFALAGAVYFLFIVLWGLNYNRNTAFKIFGLVKREVTSDMLYEIGTDLAEKLNNSVGDLKDEYFQSKNLAGRGNIGYYKLQDRYPTLGGNYADAKPILLSSVFSRLQIWGIYSPFSFESNFNTMVPNVLLPSTIAHELAHARGFAREDEADFIAYLTCINNNDTGFIYSGNLLAYINIVNALGRSDADSAKDVMQMLDPAVIKQLGRINEFEKRYESVISDTAESVNDIFLKSNRQEDGIRSYGRMVDLIVAYYYGIMGKGE
jgi:hypothetical protein